MNKYLFRLLSRSIIEWHQKSLNSYWKNRKTSTVFASKNVVQICAFCAKQSF